MLRENCCLSNFSYWNREDDDDDDYNDDDKKQKQEQQQIKPQITF